MRWGKSGQWWNYPKPYNAYGHRCARIEQHYDCPKPRRHHCRLRYERDADRIGGSFQRKLYFFADDAHLRLG